MSKQEYTRPQAVELLRRLGERRRLMQVVTVQRESCRSIGISPLGSIATRDSRSTVAVLMASGVQAE